jgi:hypothetical protein
MQRAIKNGRFVPHPRWWPVLAQMAEVVCPFDDTPNGLTLDWWQEVMVPALANVTTTAVEQATGLSSGRASKVRRGVNIPKGEHWRALTELVGVDLPEAGPLIASQTSHSLG